MTRHTSQLLAYMFSAVLALTLAYGGWLTRIDNALMALRMEAHPRDVSDSLVYVAIDKQSLSDVGVWPWPRSVHGKILDKLVAAGAGDIAFDVDFSTPSTATEDASFAAALERAGGGVLLPAFLQRSSARQDAQIELSRPISLFEDHAWLAGVSIIPDDDGQVRRFPYAISDGKLPLMSLPAVLAGESAQKNGGFDIDFSIDPAKITAISAADILYDRMDLSLVKGKKVVIGAYAVELQDLVHTPVRGTIPGPVLQLLAAETLIQGRVGPHVSSSYLLLAVLAVTLVLSMALVQSRLRVRLLVILGGMITLELINAALFVTLGIRVESAASLIFLISVAVFITLLELDFHRLVALIASTESRNTRQLLRQVIADNSDAIIIADENGHILEMSEQTSKVFRLPTRLSDKQKLVTTLLPEKIAQDARIAIAQLQQGQWGGASLQETFIPIGASQACIEYVITPSQLGSASAKGETQSYAVCITARDVTARYRQAAELKYLSRHDVLTGCLRSNEFVRVMNEAAEADGLDPMSTQCRAVFALDLHRFKTVNATLGRDNGDVLLCMAAERLAQAHPDLGHLARAGADKFTLGTLRPIEKADLPDLAMAIINAFETPFVISGHRARVGVRIGVATSKDLPVPTTERLVSAAETALENASKINGSGFELFQSSEAERVQTRREIERDLWTAIEKGEISVSYQPQVDLFSRRLIGTEALVRWTHPELGRVSPQDFVEVAEANGFVEVLGRWVLTKACMDAMLWPEDITVAVNVASLQFTRGDIVSDVEAALRQSGLPVNRLHLELTESMFLNASDVVMERIRRLKEMGVVIALDDFGTGYSSFAYLSRFPLDKIKLDQMFVRTLTKDSSSRAIIRSVHSLAQGLGITMICEGVETEAELAYLRGLGVDQGQGYLFGKPMDVDAIRQMALAEKQGEAIRGLTRQTS